MIYFSLSGAYAQLRRPTVDWSLSVKLTDDELRSFCNLFMASDPWPASEEDRAVIDALLDEESKARGYRDWIEAYHKLPRR
jgi:hypothetical protein